VFTHLPQITSLQNRISLAGLAPPSGTLFALVNPPVIPAKAGTSGDGALRHLRRNAIEITVKAPRKRGTPQRDDVNFRDALVPLSLRRTASNRTRTENHIPRSRCSAFTLAG